MSIESVMPSNHLILCCPLLLLPSIFPSSRVFLKGDTLPNNSPTGLLSRFRSQWVLSTRNKTKEKPKYRNGKRRRAETDANEADDCTYLKTMTYYFLMLQTIKISQSIFSFCIKYSTEQTTSSCPSLLRTLLIPNRKNAFNFLKYKMCHSYFYFLGAKAEKQHLILLPSPGPCNRFSSSYPLVESSFTWVGWVRVHSQPFGEVPSMSNRAIHHAT